MKMFILPKLICRLNTISIKIPPGLFLFVAYDRLKYLWKLKEHRIAKTVVEKKSKDRGLTLTDLRI